MWKKSSGKKENVIGCFVVSWQPSTEKVGRVRGFQPSSSWEQVNVLWDCDLPIHPLTKALQRSLHGYQCQPTSSVLRVRYHCVVLCWRQYPEETTWRRRGSFCISDPLWDSAEPSFMARQGAKTGTLALGWLCRLHPFVTVEGMTLPAFKVSSPAGDPFWKCPHKKTADMPISLLDNSIQSGWKMKIIRAGERTLVKSTSPLTEDLD